jgi:hypothetical protein
MSVGELKKELDAFATKVRQELPLTSCLESETCQGTELFRPANARVEPRSFSSGFLAEGYRA